MSFFFKRILRQHSKGLLGTKITRNELSTQEAFKLQQEHDVVIGQPTFRSHPHLLKPGEIVPGIQLQEIIQRREKLVKEIVQSESDAFRSIGHVVVIPSATTLYMTDKIPYVFRQNTDFRYLTGCLEPDTALLMFITSAEKYESVLITRDKNKHKELWEGPRTSAQDAVKHFGVDEAYPVSEFSNIFKSKLDKIGSYALWYDQQEVRLQDFHNAMSSVIIGTRAKEVKSPKEVIHSLRVIKSPAEIDLMTRSASIASEAINRTMAASRPGFTEHQMFATVDYHCRMNGAEILAYPPVVAAGTNANTIHYINNTQQTSPGDLVLMDAGCELHGYSSDITRSWPVDGKFSDPQRTVYDVVLSVQEDLIAKCKEMPPLDALLQEMCSTLAKRLKEAHVLTKEADNQNLEALSFKFCPHHVSHYLGMDIHDTGSVSRKIPLAEGMVITVEPGVYITKDNTYMKPEFRGFGIRIEDDVLITSSGPKVLSSSPKSSAEVEKMCNNKKD